MVYRCYDDQQGTHSECVSDKHRPDNIVLTSCDHNLGGFQGASQETGYTFINSQFSFRPEEETE